MSTRSKVDHRDVETAREAACCGPEIGHTAAPFTLSPVPDPASVHRASTRIMSTILVVLGVVLIVSTLAQGGGPLSVGVVFGLLLGGAGAARLWLERARERNR